MKRGIALQLTVIAVFAIVAYLNSFSNEFLYDDEHYVVNNPFIKDASHLEEIFTTNVVAGTGQRSNFYRPLQLIAYLAVFQVFGLNIFGFHLLNLSLHLANAFLIYFITLVLFRRKEISFATSLLFVVHPIHTEAITYMNGTADPLAACFGLLSLLLYLKADRKVGNYIVSLICFAAALLSKETILVIPFIIIILDISQRETFSHKIRKYIPYFIILACYLLARLTVFNFTRSLNLFPESNIYTAHLQYRIYTFLAGLMEYYKLLLFPLHLKYDRALVVYISPFTRLVFASILLLFSFILPAYRSFRQKRIIFLGIVWFFISLAPVAGIIPINGFAMEHWLYFPSVGVFILFSYLAVNNTRKTAPSLPGEKIRLGGSYSLVLVLALAVIFTILTRERNKDWREPITFYKTILKHNPEIARVRNNLAIAYTSRGNFEEAVEQFKLAIALEDRYPEAHYNLALVYLKMGLNREAILELHRALEIDKNFQPSRQALREIYDQLGMEEESEKYRR